MSLETTNEKVPVFGTKETETDQTPKLIKLLSKKILDNNEKLALHNELTQHIKERTLIGRRLSLEVIAGGLVWTVEELTNVLRSNDCERYIKILKEQEKNLIFDTALKTMNGQVLAKYLADRHKMDGELKAEDPLSVCILNDLKIANLLSEAKRDGEIDEATYLLLQERAKKYNVDSGNRWSKKSLGKELK